MTAVSEEAALVFSALCVRVGVGDKLVLLQLE
jgi:hypothetical protein